MGYLTEKGPWLPPYEKGIRLPPVAVRRIECDDTHMSTLSPLKHKRKCLFNTSRCCDCDYCLATTLQFAPGWQNQVCKVALKGQLEE